MKPRSDLAAMNISLPRTQRDFVEAEAARTGCTTTSEFVRRLINEAQQKAEQQDLERLLLQGLESGAAVEVSPEYWEQKREALRARHRDELN